jgi:hypothetical protein
MLDNNLKRWESLKYKNSTEWLKQLREIELKSTSLNLDDRVRALRTNKLKIWRESRQAALFCHGISKRLGHPIDIAMCEDQDYDFVARYETPGVYMNYIPVQLKEFVPDYLNLAQSLIVIFDSIIIIFPTSRDL